MGEEFYQFIGEVILDMEEDEKVVETSVEGDVEVQPTAVDTTEVEE